jgi:hypothetical protein
MDLNEFKLGDEVRHKRTPRIVGSIVAGPYPLYEDAWESAAHAPNLGFTMCYTVRLHNPLYDSRSHVSIYYITINQSDLEERF